MKQQKKSAEAKKKARERHLRHEEQKEKERQILLAKRKIRTRNWILFGGAFAIILVVVILWSPLFHGTGEAGTGTISGGVQTVSTSVGSSSYGTITVKAGTPVKWNINFTGGGCIQYIRIPEFGISKTLNSGSSNTISFTPKKPGTYTVRCSMGMYTGKIIVT
jgi:plastocyanin domain-containing protein